jgi:hypothetical protein
MGPYVESVRIAKKALDRTDSQATPSSTTHQLHTANVVEHPAKQVSSLFHVRFRELNCAM